MLLYLHQSWLTFYDIKVYFQRLVSSHLWSFTIIVILIIKISYQCDKRCRSNSVKDLSEDEKVFVNRKTLRSVKGRLRIGFG